MYQPAKEIERSKVPAALTRFLKEHPEVEMVRFHLDNDRTGRLATQAIRTVLPKQYQTRDAVKAYPSICGAILHSDCGSQYTSASYRAELSRCEIIQSMNRDGGRCHDNARCEAMWARMKEELLYGRYNTEKMTIEELKTLIWRYFIIYWNNRRICSANGGLPPMLKRKQYYDSLEQVA